jgi:predicted secreted protein
MTVQAVRGSDILVLVNTGTELLPVYEAVASQRGVTFDEATTSIDASSKASRFTRRLPGRYSGSLSLDALYIPSEDSYQALLAAMRSGEFVMLRKSVEGTEIEEARAVIASLSTSGPDNDVATFSADFDIDGEWTVIGS